MFVSKVFALLGLVAACTAYALHSPYGGYGQGTYGLGGYGHGAYGIGGYGQEAYGPGGYGQGVYGLGGLYGGQYEYGGLGHGHAVSTQNIERHDIAHHGHQGGYLGGAYGLGNEYGHGHGHYYDTYAVPNYKFDYAVKDPHTGDNKKQWETRHADHVKGGYSLVESDGSVRTVEYVADDHNGFNALVHRSTNIHPTHYQSYHH